MVTPTPVDPFDEPPLDADALAFVRLEHGPDGQEVVSSVDAVRPSDPREQPDPSAEVDLEESEVDGDPDDTDDTAWQAPR